MTVLSVAYPFARVAEDAVGGAEQVAWALDRALVRAGHRSVVVAQDGSAVEGTLLPVPAVAGEVDDAARASVHARVRESVAGALRRWPIDVIHAHGIDFPDYLPAAGPPLLATLHLPPSWYPRAVFHPRRADAWLNPVSDAQRRACPGSPHLLEPIPNGVDVDALRPARRRRGWALALGRVCPEKGFHHALDAARAADVPLLVGGHVYPYPEHRCYFDREIVPRLDGRCRFVGPVGGARKRRLLAGARCLLAPSLAPETSSLVAMEALACGTPVVAFRAGALPEIVEDGVTGFLVDDADGMAEAIRRADELDPAACRAAALARFDLRRTAARYLALYARLSRRPAEVAA